MMITITIMNTMVLLVLDRQKNFCQIKGTKPSVAPGVIRQAPLICRVRLSKGIIPTSRFWKFPLCIVDPWSKTLWLVKQATRKPAWAATHLWHPPWCFSSNSLHPTCFRFEQLNWKFAGKVVQTTHLKCLLLMVIQSYKTSFSPGINDLALLVCPGSSHRSQQLPCFLLAMYIGCWRSVVL